MEQRNEQRIYVISHQKISAQESQLELAMAEFLQEDPAGIGIGLVSRSRDAERAEHGRGARGKFAAR